MKSPWKVPPPMPGFAHCPAAPRPLHRRSRHPSHHGAFQLVAHQSSVLKFLDLKMGHGVTKFHASFSGDNFCWISWSLWEINQNHMISLGFHGTWWLWRDLLGNPGGLAMEVLERANYPRGSFTVGIPPKKRRYFLPFQWSNIGLNMVELNFEPCEPLRIALSYLIILSWLIGFPTTCYDTHQFGSISIYKSLYSPLNQAI